MRFEDVTIGWLGYGTACRSKRVIRADNPVATATGSVPVSVVCLS